MSLPPCGIYRTTEPIAGLPAGKMVYFHNHGDPGPGVYLPVGWSVNRAEFEEAGYTIEDPALIPTLHPLRAEGLYRVVSEFACCSKNCVVYGVDRMVQLGYDGDANPILFLPTWTMNGLDFPDVGHLADESQLQRLVELVVPDDDAEEEGPPPMVREDLH